MSPNRSAISLLFPVLLAANVMAQTITVTPNNPVPGTTVTVGFADPNQANQTVTITITYGSPAKTETLSMLLDNQGNGAKPYVIPNVPPTIRFNGGGAQEVVIFIL